MGAAKDMKKIPMRRCMGCNVSKPKKELIRIVRTAEGGVSVDLTGKANGRGAYVCRDRSCIQKAIKTKRLEKSLETPIPETIEDELMPGKIDG
jgi:uncharacterized protein